MNTRAYSNYLGQRFVRTSETHGHVITSDVEFETGIEMDVWLGQRGFVDANELFDLKVGRPRKDAA